MPQNPAATTHLWELRNQHAGKILFPTPQKKKCNNPLKTRRREIAAIVTGK